MSKRDEAVEVENELNSRRNDVKKVKIELQSLPHKEGQMETLKVPYMFLCPVWNVHEFSFG